jgi:hypothetical protein
LQRPGRHTDYFVTRSDILENHRCSADNCALAYLDSRKNCGMKSDMAVTAYPHASAERNAWRKMDMVGNATIVFDNCAAVDNAICPDDTVCIDYRVGHDHGSRADGCRWRHDRSRVDEGERLDAHSAGCMKAGRSVCIAADCNNKIRIARGSQLRKLSASSRNAAALKFPEQFRRIVIDENDIDRSTLCPGNIEHNFAVPTCAPDNKLVHGFALLSG